MILLLIFIFGLCVGSFLNVLIDRIPKNEQVFKGRSYCDNCKRKLKWYDMIPVTSFLFLRRKCRYCHSPISFYYPLVEILTGIIFICVYFYVLKLNNLPFTIFHLSFDSTIEQFSNLTINYVYLLFITCSLIVIFFSDLKYGIIPDKIIFPAVIITIAYQVLSILYPQIINNQLSIFNSLFSATSAFIFMFLLFLITKGKGMGFGDVKFAFLMGLVLGFPNIISAFYLAFLTGAVVGIILIIWGKKKLGDGKIPFGPFLVLGTFLNLFLGSQIIQSVLRWLSF